MMTARSLQQPQAWKQKPKVQKHFQHSPKQAHQEHQNHESSREVLSDKVSITKTAVSASNETAVELVKAHKLQASKGTPVKIYYEKGICKAKLSGTL